MVATSWPPNSSFEASDITCTWQQEVWITKHFKVFAASRFLGASTLFNRVIAFRKESININREDFHSLLTTHHTKKPQIRSQKFNSHNSGPFECFIRFLFWKYFRVWVSSVLRDNGPLNPNVCYGWKVKNLAPICPNILEFQRSEASQNTDTISACGLFQFHPFRSVCRMHH